MTPAVVQLGLAALYIVALLLIVRGHRQHVRYLHGRIATLERLNASLMGRVAASWRCEVCDRPLLDGDTASVRLGPDGYDVVAHGLCLGPMPGERPGY